MADFYGEALNNNKWQFSESVGYLRELGALDESDASNPRVIIPNYVQAQSNCIETSAYYSVCCLSECDVLMSELEGRIQAPMASPRRRGSYSRAPFHAVAPFRLPTRVPLSICPTECHSTHSKPVASWAVGGLGAGASDACWVVCCYSHTIC